MKSKCLCVVVYPRNDSTFCIMGSCYDNKCYYFDTNNKRHSMFGEIPKSAEQEKVYKHACATFKLKKNNKYYRYCLVYGGATRVYYQIFNFNTNKWEKIVSEYNDIWSDDENIMYGVESPYFFGKGCSMVNDIFNENIIHIAGGYHASTKYGWFKMDDTFNKPNQS